CALPINPAREQLSPGPVRGDEEEGEALDELGEALVYAEELQPGPTCPHQAEEEGAQADAQWMVLPDEGDPDPIEAVGRAEAARVLELGAQHPHRARQTGQRPRDEKAAQDPPFTGDARGLCRLRSE